MVVDALIVLASWHPGHESEYNNFNPGLIMSVGAPQERVIPYVMAGAYYDSNRNTTAVIGGGMRFGDDRFGIDVGVAHVHGSDLEDYPVVVVPSVYYTEGRYSFQAILTPKAVAFGVRYQLWR